MLSLMAVATLIVATPAEAAYRFANFTGRPPLHQFGGQATCPQGLTPSQIKKAYNLPSTGGHGTIAIIDVYDAPYIESDLGVFDKQFGLAACTTANGCLEKHKMASDIKADAGWASETTLDVEWAHAIAPQAKILLVEAKTASGQNLLNAIDYARGRSGVVAVSMSWGGDETSDEVSLDCHFQSANNKITFFASSGDDGAGPSWPAVALNVVAVGGTTLKLNKDGGFKSETAWKGSGGGLSAYETEPAYQLNYSILKTHNQRAIPDVAYNADPQTGFSVYFSSSASKKGWDVFGGTSAGAPQWAGIKSLGLMADNNKF